MYLILLISLILLILVLIPGIGVRIRSASRWIKFGPLVIQPSEFAKLAIIIFLAYSMARKQEKIRYFSIGFLPHIVVAGIFILLIEKEPDFGTAMALAGITFLMLFVGGTRLTHIFLAVLSASPLVVYVILKNKMRLERVITFIDPVEIRPGKRLSIGSLPLCHRLRRVLGSGYRQEPGKIILPAGLAHRFYFLHPFGRTRLSRRHHGHQPVCHSHHPWPYHQYQGPGQLSAPIWPWD